MARFVPSFLLEAVLVVVLGEDVPPGVMIASMILMMMTLMMTCSNACNEHLVLLLHEVQLGDQPCSLQLVAVHLLLEAIDLS